MMKTCKIVHITELISYLQDTLGLQVSVSKWGTPSSMPIFLTNAAEYYLCRCDGIDFVAACTKCGNSLPELKRVSTQLARHTSLPITLVSEDIDPRQRKALISQGIAFVVPGRQAYLPFLALVASTEAERRSYGGALSARAQAAFVTLIANPDITTAQTLRETSGMSASSITRAVAELAHHELIQHGKDGRNVTIDYDTIKNALLRRAMPLLTSPVTRTFFVFSDAAAANLPDAGESALATRSMLNPPRIAQKAVARHDLRSLTFREVLEGEFDDSETIQIQAWSYDPLVADLGKIDKVSLALSLAPEDDERIFEQLNELFNEEDLWH
jgi:hypothetical protein